MILSIYRTQGHSMEPKINNGSFFIASSLPFKFRDPLVGDIILFRNNNKNVVKKISKINDEQYFIEGENNKDSLKFSSLNRKDIIGKVLFIK